MIIAVSPQIKVWFVDYGNTATISSGVLYRIPDCLCQVGFQVFLQDIILVGSNFTPNILKCSYAGNSIQVKWHQNNRYSVRREGQAFFVWHHSIVKQCSSGEGQRCFINKYPKLIINSIYNWPSISMWTTRCLCLLFLQLHSVVSNIANVDLFCNNDQHINQLLIVKGFCEACPEGKISEVFVT